MPVRVPFGLKDGLLYSPLQVPNGKLCGCVCPGCQHPLIARQNAQTPHFAHSANEDCQSGYESAIHLAAKQLIQERMQIALPEAIVEYPGGYGKRPQTSVYGVSQIIQLSKVDLEVWQNGIRPDLIATNAVNNQQFLIEIAVTHFCDENKIEYIKQNGWYAIEIPIPKSTDINFQVLERILFGVPSVGKWISHPEIKQLEIEYVRKNKKDWEDRQREQELRFEKYRNLSARDKISRNLKKLGVNQSELVKLTSFVAGENSFKDSRLAWQSAVLVYIANVIEEDGIDGEPCGAYIESDVVIYWLRRLFEIKPTFKDAENIALWKYLIFLDSLGILKRRRSAFEIIRKVSNENG